MKTRVDIEKIKAAQDVINAFNHLALNEVEFFENGEQVQIPDGVIDEYRFTGLNNRDFITMGFYTGNPDPGRVTFMCFNKKDDAS
jgi:hypothetical protein